MIPSEVRRGVWVLPIVSGLPYGRVTNCVAILDETDGLHLIDPGWNTNEAWDALVDQLAAIGLELAAVRTIGVTHVHGDHLGQAERIRNATGAPVALSRIEQSAIDRGVLAVDVGALERWQVPADARSGLRPLLERRILPEFRADILLDGGDRFPIAGRNVDVIATPGHTTGHIAFHLVDCGVVVTGDHVLPKMNSGLALGAPSDTDTVQDYLDALERVAVENTAIPGHGGVFDTLPARTVQLAEHHRRRSAEVALVLAEGLNGIWDVAQRVKWSAGWSGLSGSALVAALAQTEVHVRHLSNGGSLPG